MKVATATPNAPWNGLQQKQEILELFCSQMREFGINMSSEDTRAIGEAIAAILRADTPSITTIPLEMGRGKSTLLKLLLEYLAKNYSSFGAVVVKERIEDAEELVSSLTDDYGEQIAYAWKGFRPKECRKEYTQEQYFLCSECEYKDCHVKTARKAQVYYPVVVITHERLFLKANSTDLLGSMSFWIDRSGEKRPRTFLFIDERPNFVDTSSFTEGEFYNFMNAIEPLYNEDVAEISWQQLRRKGIERLNRIRQSKHCLRADKEAVYALGTIEKSWWQGYQGDDRELFNTFLDFFTVGGMCLSGTSSKIVTARKTSYSFDGLSTIILDGTAAIDWAYPENSNLLKVDTSRDFSHVTIWHDDSRNLSKTHMRDIVKSSDGIKAYAEDIVQVAATGRTLVICANDFKAYFQKELQEVPNVEIGHFNALKGTNNYRDCSNIYIAGTMHFGDENYAWKAILKDPARVTSFETRTINRRHHFCCGFIDEVERKDKLAYILQDIFRGSIRNPSNTSQMNVYLFNTDSKLVEYIADFLPGCTVKAHRVAGLHAKTAKRQHRLMEVLNENLKEVGDEIRKSKLRELAGIGDPRTLRKLLSHPFIQQYLSENSIVNYYNYLRRENGSEKEGRRSI